MIAMSYDYVYVTQATMGASMTQTIKAFRDASHFDPGFKS
jgi:pyruvate/2-oxoacid:ferredoxin oxidoreductase beta subunit